MASTTTSKPLCLLLNLAKPALMSKLSAILFISSCGDVISNRGPSIESRRKSKCNICQRTIACNHRTVQCKSCSLDLHYKCAGLSVKEYRDICSASSSRICTKCLLEVLLNSSYDTFSSQTSSISFTNVVAETADHGFSGLLANVWSIKNKLQAFHAMIYSTRIDIIALTGT